MNRVVEVIKSKIQSTRDIIESTRKQYAESDIPSFLADLELSSLEQRLIDLEREYYDIISTEGFEKLTVKLHPPGMLPGQIPIRTLSPVLGGLQTLAESVANTLYNQPSERGTIPQEILDQSTLIWREERAGSFEVILDMQHSEQTQINDPMQVQTIQELFRLFNAMDKTDVLMESISTLGSRTLKNYREWTKTLRDTNTPIEIEWSSSVKGKEKISFTTNKAEKIYSILNDISETSEEEVTEFGRLTGANVRTRTFELYLPDGQKITGRIAQDALSVVAAIVLDSKCKATLMKSVATYQSQREKIFWTLQDITVHDF